jgi:hypothetical protein
VQPSGTARTNGRRLAVVLLGALAVLLAAGAAGHASPHASPHAAYKPLKAIFGPLTMPDGASAFPVYRRLGVQVLELELPWDAVAPTRPSNPTDPADPAYRWPAEMDRAVAQAARFHIALAVLVEDFPAWSNGGRDPSWEPSDPMDYADYVQAASRRYPSVRLWMILDEVNSSRPFKPMPPNSPVGPEHYARLLQDAYGALKGVSRANKVIGGMTYSTGVVGTYDFIRWMRLPDGRPPSMDYYGHNPYSIRYPNLAEKSFSPLVCDINDIDTLDRRLRDIYHGHAPKLWLSEFGIGNSPNPSFDYYVSRSVQARWVTAAFRLVDSVPYVAGLGWYELLDEPSSNLGGLTEGLMSANGTPKPSFYAYAAAP